jgi:hypothetical protein
MKVLYAVKKALLVEAVCRMVWKGGGVSVLIEG